MKRFLMCLYLTILVSGCATQTEQSQYWQSKGYSAEAAQRIVTGQTTEDQEKLKKYQAWEDQRQAQRKKYCATSEYTQRLCAINDRIRARQAVINLRYLKLQRELRYNRY